MAFSYRYSERDLLLGNAKHMPRIKSAFYMYAVDLPPVLSRAQPRQSSLMNKLAKFVSARLAKLSSL
jgi:hypothetical protein